MGCTVIPESKFLSFKLIIKTLPKMHKKTRDPISKNNGDRPP